MTSAFRRSVPSDTSALGWPNVAGRWIELLIRLPRGPVGDVHADGSARRRVAHAVIASSRMSSSDPDANQAGSPCAKTSLYVIEEYVASTASAIGLMSLVGLPHHCLGDARADDRAHADRRMVLDEHQQREEDVTVPEVRRISDRPASFACSRLVVHRGDLVERNDVVEEEQSTGGEVVERVDDIPVRLFEVVQAIDEDHVQALVRGQRPEEVV